MSDQTLLLIVRVTGALAAACIGILLVAVPASLIWGHHGPDWPWAIAIPLAVAGAAFVLYRTRNVRV